MESVPDFRGAGWRGLEAEGTARHELPPERAEPTSGPEPGTGARLASPSGPRSGCASSGGPWALWGRIRALLLLLGPIADLPNYPRTWALNSTALCFFAPEPSLQPGKIKVTLMGVARLANKVGFIIPERATALSTSAPKLKECCLTGPSVHDCCS
jgi:hypothetical protein